LPAGFGYGYLGYGIGPYGGDPIAALPISYYLSLIPSQYQSSPKFLAFVTMLLKKFDDVTNCLLDFTNAFDLNYAIGVQLDALGQILGISRTLPFQPSGGLSPILGDKDYRTLLLAKVYLNLWNGEADALQPLWQNIFPSGTIVIDDAQNMSATIVLSGTFTALAQQMITNGMIIPRPAGVLYNYTFAELPIFGFDLNNGFVAGFDVGHWS
jgi:hypothetical protein